MDERRGDSYRWAHPEFDKQPKYQQVLRAIRDFPGEMVDRAYALFGVGVREIKPRQEDSGKRN
jgi:hypothetical protein